MIAVALSGGIDSALAAALLKEEGEEVVGLFMDLGLVQAGAHASARKVAEHLKIKLVVVDLAATFRQRVIEPFLDTYAQGQTPNPCVRCNEQIKFRELLGKAGELGAERLATGHYCLLAAGRQGPELLRGVEEGKEQSYFLARLERDWLERIRFPLGRLTKDQARRLAAERGLPSAGRAESQEICFLGGEDYRAFFLARRRPTPGQMVDLCGRVVGRHQGLFAYTVGQRKGLGLCAPEPTYVVAADKSANRLIVGPAQALLAERDEVGEPSWLAEPDELDRAAGEVLVQFRYRARPATAKLELKGQGRVCLLFDKPQRAVAPGQLAAFYQGARLLGGGWLAPCRVGR
ncbi:MAG: tRNA 2-thiouridine(34) synthase MnmA [Deltaproteobacteria bacterium]|nr:tRNA 2-thiouridine(34) synthase MnmA [Deltaproteobacteria bacterium]